MSAMSFLAGGARSGWSRSQQSAVSGSAWHLRHGILTPPCARRYAHSWSNISHRDFASLEDQIFRAGSRVVDPILKTEVGQLNWLQRRIQVTKDSEPALMTLRLPSLLHPSLSELQHSIQTIATTEFEQWKANKKYDLDLGIKVEVTPSKPIPSMARYAENHEELTSQLGPGLVNVSQFIAVYSCKVSA